MSQCVVCRATKYGTAELHSVALLAMVTSGQSSVDRIILDLCDFHLREVRRIVHAGHVIGSEERGSG